MNHQSLQHTSSTQWSEIPEIQLQQTSQLSLSSLHHPASHLLSSSAASSSLPQVCCSMTQLQPSTRSNSPLTAYSSTLQHHTQCTQNTPCHLSFQHLSLEFLQITLGRLSRKGSAQISQQRRLNEDTRPHSTPQIHSKSSRVFRTMTFHYLLPTLLLQQATTQSNNCVYINRPRYTYTVLQIIVPWWNTLLKP